MHWIPIATAEADGLVVQPPGNFRQSDSMQGGYLIRERRYDNGTLESFKIDPRTGAISEYSLKGTTDWKLTGNNTSAVIDLDRMKQ